MRQLRHSVLQAMVPPWVKPSTEGFKILFAIAAALDATIEFAQQGMLARLPGLGTPTALPRHGRDRLIRRGFAESDRGYARRLVRWRPNHKQAGSPFATMRQLVGYVTPHSMLMRIVNSHSTWYTLAEDDTAERYIPSPANWDWDGQGSTLFSRFWLLLYPPLALWVRDGTWVNSPASTWGDDPEATWGSTATVKQIRDVRAIVDDWRSAGALLSHIVVVLSSPNDFDPTNAAPPLPDGQWATYSKLDAGGNCVPARSADAIYWAGQAS